MSNKIINMTITDGNTQVSIREVFNDMAPWSAIAYQFHKFLAAQGYHLEPEDVGAEVDSYVSAIDNIEVEAW
jgi:hypothetical protein